MAAHFSIITETTVLMITTLEAPFTNMSQI